MAKKTAGRQMDMFGGAESFGVPVPSNVAQEPKVEDGMEIHAATELMRRVAERATNIGRIDEYFTPEDIGKIMEKRRQGEETTKEEGQRASKATRANKKWVKTRAMGDYGRLFMYPSYTDSKGKIWYKMLDFSALYYAYCLADAMGVTANVMNDTDKYVRAEYVVSVYDPEIVAEKFYELGMGTVLKTMTGVYILELTVPAAYETYQGLMQKEHERREKLENATRPAAMAPETYTKVLEAARLLGDKLAHMQKYQLNVLGSKVMEGMSNLLKIYFLYSDGFIDKATTAKQLIDELDRMRGEVVLLGELDAWGGLSSTAMVADIMLQIRMQIVKDFKIKIGKDGVKHEP